MEKVTENEGKREAQEQQNNVADLGKDKIYAIQSLLIECYSLKLSKIIYTAAFFFTDLVHRETKFVCDGIVKAVQRVQPPKNLQNTHGA